MTPTAVIGSYTAAIAIDGTTNFLLIQPGNSSTAYKKINRNVFLGVTGQPVDISTTQTLSNKILDNSNLVTLLDGSFTLQNNVDTTKRAVFSAAGITTSTTRTYTLPNNSSTLVDLITTQTLTNKTLTAPSISGGTIDNATVTVDTISGHTVAGNGTVYGLSIHSGVIQTSGAGGTTFLQTNAVQANQLATNAIKLGSTTKTANFTTTSTSAVQVTGLTLTVTIPAGSRSTKISLIGPAMTNSGANSLLLTLWDGTVGSGTQLAAAAYDPYTANAQVPVSMVALVSPAAGSKTYNVGFQVASGTGTIVGGATSPMFFFVEAD